MHDQITCCFERISETTLKYSHLMMTAIRHIPFPVETKCKAPIQQFTGTGCEQWYHNPVHKYQLVGGGIMDRTDPCECGGSLMEEDKALQFLSRSQPQQPKNVQLSCPSDIMRSLSTCKIANSCLLIVLWKKRKFWLQFHVCPFLLGSFMQHHSISSTICLQVRARTSCRAC